MLDAWSIETCKRLQTTREKQNTDEIAAKAYAGPVHNLFACQGVRKIHTSMYESNQTFKKDA